MSAASQCNLRNRAFRYRASIVPLVYGKRLIKAYSALATEQIRKAQIEELESKLNALKQNLALETSETQLTLDQFARSDCRKLADLLVTKLPREVRDMVYEHLNKGTEKHIDSNYFRSTRDPITKYYTFDHARQKALHYPEHFRNEAFVGQVFAREVAENHYLTSTFIFDDSKDALSKFLDTDEMGLGFAPRLFVANVEVHVRAYCHDCSSFQAYMYGLVKAPERLKGALEGLFGLRRHASVGVHFLTEAKSAKERDELFVKAMPELLETLERAVLEGYRVRFFLDKRFEFRPGAHAREEWLEQLSGVSRCGLLVIRRADWCSCPGRRRWTDRRCCVLSGFMVSGVKSPYTFNSYFAEQALRQRIEQRLWCPRLTGLGEHETSSRGENLKPK